MNNSHLTHIINDLMSESKSKLTFFNYPLLDNKTNSSFY